MSLHDTLSHLLTGEKPRQTSSSEGAGWTERHVYRARTEDSSFTVFDDICKVCGERHTNPYEGDPAYITKRVPVRVAKNWARHHNVVTHVEQRAAYVHTKMRRVNRVQLVPYTDWQIIRTIRP
ncbi:MAG: hypothetical protein ACP5FL_01160 [Thermoplasmatota archaeon]